eukprot:2746381-Pleurochrysis_carterae.AAC.1
MSWCKLRPNGCARWSMVTDLLKRPPQRHLFCNARWADASANIRANDGASGAVSNTRPSSAAFHPASWIPKLPL